MQRNDSLLEFNGGAGFFVKGADETLQLNRVAAQLQASAPLP